MNTRKVFGRLLSLALALLLVAASRQDPVQDPARKLQRLAPVPLPAAPEEDALGRVFGREFDRERWRSRLATSDLDAREVAYEDLLRRARIDAVARAFVDELARDESAPELAWTARLAQRELARNALPAARMFPLSWEQSAQERQLEALLEELLDQHPELNLYGATPLRPFALSPPEGTGSTYGLQIVETPQGTRVVVTERGGRREYAGESLEAILERHPELRDRMHVSAPQSRPIRMDKLGVRVVPVAEVRAQELGLGAGEGLVVLSTYPGTIATLLGVRSGDVLVALNGTSLGHPDDITVCLDALSDRASEERRVDLVWFDDLGQRHARSWPPR